jgi:hypothetical protein
MDATQPDRQLNSIKPEPLEKAEYCLSYIYLFIVFHRVSDPNSFDTDPDPAFYAEYRSGSRVFMTKNLKKITAEKKIGSKTTSYLSLGLHRGRQSYKSFSSQREHPALQNMKFHNIFYLVGHFCPPGSGTGFRIRIRIH